MHRIRGMICFYLTVAVMITVALMPFASGNVINNKSVQLTDEKATEEYSSASWMLSDSFAETDIDSINEEIPEFYSEASDEGLSVQKNDVDDHTDINTAISTDEVYEADAENLSEDKNSEDVNSEDKNSEDVNSEDVISGQDEQILSSEEAAESQLNNSAAKDFITIDNSADSVYVPGSEFENVSGLNFFTDTQGILESSYSVNVHEFTLDSRSVFRYTVLHEEFTGREGWNFDLYAQYYVNGDGVDTAYRLVNSLSTTTATSDRSVELGLPAGNYRLVVSAGAAFTGSVYSIRVECSDTYEYEVECNDNVYRYTEIYGDVPLKGSASYIPGEQDQDWYMFRMYDDGYAELKFTYPTEKDKLTVCWQVIFYSEDMTPLFSVNATFDKGIFESGRIGLEKGNYYVAVISRVYSAGTYTLEIDRNTVSDHENERNDTMATANAIAPNTTVLGAVSDQINGIDVDYYRFTLEKAGTVSVEFSHTPIEDEDDRLGWNYSLIDADGNVLFCGVSAWIDDVSVSSLTGLDAGTYYIRVDSEGLYHSTEKYYISLIYNESDDWETESNDSFSKADEIENAVMINGLLADKNVDYDYDYYTFELKQGGNISVVFSHEKLSYSREIFVFTLYDENNNAVKTDMDGKEVSRVSIKSDAEEVTVSYEGLPAGRYYIKVTTGIFFDSIGYSLMYKTS